MLNFFHIIKKCLPFGSLNYLHIGPGIILEQVPIYL